LGAGKTREKRGQILTEEKKGERWRRINGAEGRARKAL
jgi:hypothetical protein